MDDVTDLGSPDMPPLGGSKGQRSELQVAEPKHPPLKFEVPRGLLARLKLAHLLGRFPDRLVWAGFMFVNGFATNAILAAVAMVSGVPFVFPSLGPTAFLLFFTPTAPTASPRNTIVGHAIGIFCGYGALWIAGLEDAQSAAVTGVNGPRSPEARTQSPL